MTFGRYISNTCPPVRPLAIGKLHIVILYERLGHVSKAMPTCLHLTEELADECTADYRLWRLDLTLEPAFSVEAERDLAAADVIIMAIDGRQTCPLEFHRWKHGAGHQGGPAPHAIIALMDIPDGPAPAEESWSGLLHAAATPIHSEVFVCESAQG